MDGVRAWFRWEMGRRIDVTTFLRLVIAERFVKGGVLLLGGIALLVLGSTTDVHRLVADIQDQLDMSTSGALWRRAVGAVLERVGSVDDSRRNELAVAVLLYGGLEVVEGLGLVLRRRWAEYLLLVATAAFIPLEVDELARHVTVLKVGALLLNVAIVAYLVWRKRLFLERPEPYPQPA